MSQQRVLIITRNLPPLVGGMERLNWHMADELSKYAEVKVIGPQGSAELKPQSVSLSEVPLKPLPLFLFIAACKAVWFALRWKPDVILAGSGLTAPIAWLASKLCGAKSAAYLHGFDITVQDKIYQRLWTPTFKKLDRIIVNSHMCVIKTSIIPIIRESYLSQARVNQVSRRVERLTSKHVANSSRCV